MLNDIRSSRLHRLFLVACSALVGGLIFLGCQTGQAAASKPKTVRVTVDENGYSPSSIDAKAGQPLTLVFERTTDQGCGQEVVFPEQELRRKLPLDQEVKIELTPREEGTLSFTCGMGMYRGSILVAR